MADRYRTRRPARTSGRRLIAAVAMAALCLLASACGTGNGSGSAVANLDTTTAAPNASTGTSTAETPAAAEQEMLAFSTCMRKHGVTTFPDPTRNADGSYGFTAGSVGTLRKLLHGAQTALDACQPLLVKSGILSAENISKFRQQMLAYARCMRSHGVSNFPDPNFNGRFGGQLKNLDRNSPNFQAATTACRPTLSKAIGAFTVAGASG